MTTDLVSRYVWSWTGSSARLWRKNRRQNAGGSYGVDLNRNWGIIPFSFLFCFLVSLHYFILFHFILFYFVFFSVHCYAKICLQMIIGEARAHLGMNQSKRMNKSRERERKRE